MEALLSSDLMNDSDLDGWNPEHNPFLGPPPLISSCDSDSHTIDGHFLGIEPSSEMTDINLNKTIDSPFANAWRKESHEEIDFADFNSSSPAWLEGEDDNNQRLNQQPSTDKLCLSSNIHSPSALNETNFSNSLDKVSDTLLDSDILRASDLYSPLKESNLLNAAESATLTLESDIEETEESGHFSSLQEKCSDLWRAVGVMETRNEGEHDTFSEGQPLTVSNVDQPLCNGVDQSLCDGVVQTDHACTPNSINHSLPNAIHSQSQCLPNASSHPFGSPAPLGWLHHSAHYPMRNQIRFRKSRCRKPLLRNFHSNFFRLPIQSKSKSPQLKMVKLFRSNGPGGKDPNEQEEVSHIPESSVSKKPPNGLSADDNPELAFMKTVDMPSGKRVEDIYVVPSVWISGKGGEGTVMNDSRLDCRSGMPHGMKMPGTHLIGGNSLYQGLKNHRGEDAEGCQNAGFSSIATSEDISPPCHITSNTATPATIKIHRPEEEGNQSRRNLIITTLNAPKIDMIPCLKDLCKAVLKDHSPSQHKQIKTFSTAHTSSSPVNVTALSSECVISTDKSDPHVTYIKDPITLSRESKHNYESLKNNEKDQLNLDLSIETSCLNKPTDLINSLSYQDTPQLDDFSSPNASKDIHVDKEQVNFGLDDSEVGSSPLTLSYNDNLTLALNAVRDEVLPGLDAIVHHETSDPAATFASTLTHMNMMTASNSCESVHSSYDNTNDGLNEPAHAVSSVPEVSSSSSFIDSPFPGEMEEDETFNPPDLITLMRQIRELHTNDPINKPLANLSTTLHLLHDAETTLCNANFGVYQQLKMGRHSKFGQLIRCILSLTSTVVMMGKSLYEWTRSSTDHQCLKTVEILANLYQTNIINLIELITPYFHYVCSLIASCHSDILMLNKIKTSMEADRDQGHQSFNLLCPQEPMNEALAGTTNSHYASCYEHVGTSDEHSKDLEYHDANTFCQNNPRYVQLEDEFSKSYTSTANFSHTSGRSPPSSKNHQKKPKVSLLKNGLSVPAITSQRSPYMRKADSKTSSFNDLKHSAVKQNNPPAAKAVLINVNPNRVFNAAKSPVPPQTHVHQPAIASQHKTLHHQHKSSLEPTLNQIPCVVSFRAPLQDIGKNLQTYNMGGPKPFRIHDSTSRSSGVFISNKANDKDDSNSVNRKH